MKVAIIGLGEVGRCYANALANLGGVDLLLCEQSPSSEAQGLGKSLGVRVFPSVDSWLGEADWVFSCVTGTVSLKVLTLCLPFMFESAGFADFTTTSPDTKRECAARSRERGIGYVDVAVMGGISLQGAKTPLLCAGDKAESFSETLCRVGSPCRTLEHGHAGDAIALKMLRSIFTKGMEALAVEVLVEAERQGLRTTLYDVLSDINEADLPKLLEGLVSSHVVHAHRRLHEVEEVQRQLEAAGRDSDVITGVRKRFATTSSNLNLRPLRSERPSLDDALAWLSVKP